MSDHYDDGWGWCASDEHVARWPCSVELSRADAEEGTQ
jgi:hypothetical protein